MLVCLCQGISEKRVKAAIRSGACTRKQVTKACRAGGGCGGCHDVIKEMIAEHGSPAEPAARQPERADSEDRPSLTVVSA